MPKFLYIFCFGLCIVVYLLNVGMGAITMDEPTRALVAMEMIYSGNVITPTIFGEFYYNKPPFYNWILSIFFIGTNNYSELILRLPAVIPLFFFTLTIFFHTKKYLTWEIAAMAAIMFISHGRMLFTSSMVGHIDIFYSWLTYLSFIIVFELSRKQQWVLLFILTYLITGITFLCKGLPSLVFQAITLLSWFIYQRKFRLLLSWKHFLGIGVLATILFSYFYAYHQYNSIWTYVETLWHESSKRTPLEKSLLDSFIHLFSFPFEVLGHILPWSILILFTFSTHIWNVWRNNNFLVFCLLIFCANVVPYWLSPDTHPRYLFMLFPFLFILLSHAYFSQAPGMKKRSIFIHIFFICISILLCLGILVIPFLPDFRDHELLANIQQLEILNTFPYLWPKVIFLLIVMGVTTYFLIKLPNLKLILFAIMLMWFRLVFDWFVIPHRAKTGKIAQYRENGIYVARLTEGTPLYIYGDYTFNHDMTYYISRERREILRKTNKIDTDAFYICNKSQLQKASYKLFHAFEIKYGRTPVFLVKFLKEQ